MNASDILNRITKHRRGQADFFRWLIERDELLAQKVRNCGTFLHLREWLKHDVSALINANFCKRHLLCPACSWRRGIRAVARYMPKVETVMQESPALIPAMITLGVVNGEDLGERMGHLKKAVKSMGEAARKAKSKTGCKHGNALIEWNKIAGSIRAIEVTNKANGWHPHVHVFALMTDYIDREKLSAEWRRFTGDSFIVDVRKCRGGVIAGLLEVIKYAVKFADLSHEHRLEAHRTMGGMRLLDPQGNLRGVETGDIDQDDLPELDGPTRDMIAHWLWNASKFNLTELKPDQFLERSEEAKLSCARLVPSS